MTVKEVTLKSGKTAYRVRVNRVVDGKRKPVVRQCRTKAEAGIVEAHLKLDIANGTFRDKRELKEEAPEIVTFRDYYQQWWPIYITTVESSTAYKTRGLFENWLLPTFGDMKLVDIKPAKVQAEVLKWSKSTTKAYHERFVYLRKILGDAVDLDLIPKNPCSPVKVPPMPRSGNPAYWSPAQIQKFFICIDCEADPEKYTILLFAASVGLRREELVALRIGNLDMASGTVKVERAIASGLEGMYEKGTKSGAGTRTLPLMPMLIRQLKVWLEVRGGCANDWLFPSPDDWSRHIDINRPNSWFKEVREAHKLTPKITLHGLRHSFITNALRAGVDVSAVQHLAGHASPEITLKVYAGLNLNDARDGISKLDKFMQAETGNISGNIDTSHDAKTPS